MSVRQSFALAKLSEQGDYGMFFSSSPPLFPHHLGSPEVCLACPTDSQADPSDDPTLRKDQLGVFGKNVMLVNQDLQMGSVTDLLWINQSSLHV